LNGEKWPPALDAAIREEIVRGKLRPIEVWEKVCAGTLDGLNPIPIEVDYWNLATIRQGRVLRAQWFADRGAALEAAGLSE
jgi:hypothetical protein